MLARQLIDEKNHQPTNNRLYLFDMEDGEFNHRFNDRVFTSNYTDQEKKYYILDVVDVRE
jgi:hypothetical protein